jgi:hypothetical protein
MRKLLHLASGAAGPLAVAAALAYKVNAQQVADPVFLLLLVALPASAVCGMNEIRRVRPPARLRFAWQKGIRAKHWDQALGGDPRQTRHVTSVVVPVRLANRDAARSLTVAEVAVRDRLSGAVLGPPPPTRMMVGDDAPWMYMACEMAFAEILNADRVVVPPASFKDTAVVIQESGIHRERYDLEVRFRDNYGRKYRQRIALTVAEHGYHYETTEQAGALSPQPSGKR